MREVEATKPPPQDWLSRTAAFFDRVVLAVAPAYGTARIAARRQSDILMRTFEGASHDKTRGDAWLGSNLSPDSALEEDLGDLRSRSRELMRNDAVGGAIDNSVNHVVGTGFTPRCNISEKIVGKEMATICREELESLYKRWCRGVDISGRTSLWQLTRLVHRNRRTDGEALAVWSDDPVGDKPVPLTIEVIDVDRLETPPEYAGNPLVRLGIEKDQAGRIVAYHIRRAHPGDTLNQDQKFDRVPAHRVLHVFERWFAGQTRGLPWLCRALQRLKDAKDLDDAELCAAQVQACFAVFVKKPGNPAAAAAAAASGTSNGKRYEEIRPGRKDYLAPGEEVVFAQPTRGNSFVGMMQHIYRRIASAINQPYAILCKDWGGVSFAGGRLILAEFRLDCKSEQKLLIEQFLIPIWNRFVDEAVMLGLTSIEPRFWARRPWIYQEHAWQPQAWPYAITPAEEVQANIDAVDHNQKTLESVVAESGEDLEEVLDQRKRERQLERTYQIEPPDREKVNAAAATKAAAPQKVQQTMEAAA